MLTIKQLVAIETQNVVPPLHVGDLRKKFGPGPLSLRSIINQVGNREALLFVQVRDASSFKSVTSVEQFQAVWKKSAPSKATVFQLYQTLRSAGASIVYISKDRRTVGIRGKTEILATIPCIPVQVREGLGYLGGGTLGAGGILIGVGLAVAGPPGWLVVLGGGLAGYGFGTLVGLGILTCVCDPTGSTPAPEPTIVNVTIPEVEDIYVYPDLPPGVPVEDGAHFPPMEIHLDDIPGNGPPDGNGPPTGEEPPIGGGDLGGPGL